MLVRNVLRVVGAVSVSFLAANCGTPVSPPPLAQSSVGGDSHADSSRLLRPYRYSVSDCFSVSYQASVPLSDGPGETGAPASLAWSCATANPHPRPITLTLDFGGRHHRIGEFLYTLPSRSAEEDARPSALIVDLGPERPLRSLDLSGFIGGQTAALRVDSDEAVDTIDIRIVGAPASKADGIQVPLGTVAVFERATTGDHRVMESAPPIHKSKEIRGRSHE